MEPCQVHRFCIPYFFSVSVSVSISVIPFSAFRFPDAGFLVWVLPWGHAKQWHLTWKLKSSRLKLRKKRSSSKGDVNKKVSANWSRLYVHFQGDEAKIENGGTLLNKIWPEYFVKNALIVTLETAAWNCLELNLSVSMPAEHEERVRWRRPSCSAVLAGHWVGEKGYQPKMVSYKTCPKRIQGPTILSGLLLWRCLCWYLFWAGPEPSLFFLENIRWLRTHSPLPFCFVFLSFSFFLLLFSFFLSFPFFWPHLKLNLKILVEFRR